MSEAPGPSPELHLKTPEQESHHEQAEAQPVTQEKQQYAEPSVDAITQSIDRLAKSSAEMAPRDEQAPEPRFIDRKTKQDVLKSTLNQVRRQLPTASRLFSKVAHSKPVYAASEVGAKTVARPSGLLGGGLGAFIGSLALLLAAKKYGFRYNFASFIVLFAGGFILGLVLELVFRLFRRKRALAG